MKWATRRRFAAIAFACAAMIATSGEAQPTAPGLDGTWEGELAPVEAPGTVAPPRDFALIRLQIDLRNVRVFMNNEEVKSGAFTIERNGTNAVISAIQADPGAPVGRSRVETWAFVVTLDDPNTLIVNYVRVVNNNNRDASEEGARFSQIRTGRLRRVR